VPASVVSLVAAPATAEQWGSYHWANNGTGLSLTIQHTFRNGDWTDWYAEAVADWGTTTKTNITLTDQGAYTGTTSKRCDPIAGKALVCSDLYGSRGWLGVATIWATGDHITQATTKLNDSYYTSATYNTPGWRDLVACQEIGHDFGLDHQDETFDNYNLGTCMDYTNAPDGGTVGGVAYGPDNRSPNAADYATLTSNAMYGSGHNDGTGGGGGGNCNPRSPKCSGGQDAFTFREVGKPTASAAVKDSGQWGQAVAFDAQGRPSLAFALAHLSRGPNEPTCMGVFRQVERPVYGEAMTAQIEHAVERLGPGSVDKLLHSGDTWTVS
jgi:hypothetical protein